MGINLTAIKLMPIKLITKLYFLFEFTNLQKQKMELNY